MRLTAFVTGTVCAISAKPIREAGLGTKMEEQFDAHRVIGLMFRGGRRHKWRLTIRQYMAMRMHVATCYECNEKIEKAKRENPRIGPPPEAN